MKTHLSILLLLSFSVMTPSIGARQGAFATWWRACGSSELDTADRTNKALCLIGLDLLETRNETHLIKMKEKFEKHVVSAFGTPSASVALDGLTRSESLLQTFIASKNSATESCVQESVEQGRRLEAWYADLKKQYDVLERQKKASTKKLRALKNAVEAYISLYAKLLVDSDALVQDKVAEGAKEQAVNDLKQGKTTLESATQELFNGSVVLGVDASHVLHMTNYVNEKIDNAVAYAAQEEAI